MKVMIHITLAIACTGCLGAAAGDANGRDQGRLSPVYQHLERRCEAERLSAQSDHEELQAKAEKNQQESLSLRAEKKALQAHAHRLAQEIERLHQAQVLRTKKSTKIKASLVDMKRALNERFHRKEEAEKRIARYKQLMGYVASLDVAGEVWAGVRDGRALLGLSTDAHFHGNSARLNPHGMERVRQLTQFLMGFPDTRFEIAGHTDNQLQRGEGRSKRQKAFQLAHSVLRFMVSVGLPASRVHASSYGEYRAVATNGSEMGRQNNRRVEIVIVADHANLPGSEELKEESLRTQNR